MSSLVFTIPLLATVIGGFIALVQDARHNPKRKPRGEWL
jgi:hypothetical protein